MEHALVVYRARTDGKTELFSAPTDASHPPRRESGRPIAGSGVGNGSFPPPLHFVSDQPREPLPFRIRAAGDRVVYIADLETSGSFQLYLGFLKPVARPR